MPDRSQHAHNTVTTQFVSAGNNIKFAYRRFGAAQGVPLVLLHHFRATMDLWDPAVTDALAASRPVILVDNAGIGRSGGQAPDTIQQMAADIAAFIEALGLEQVDVLGFSIGGMVAQQLALDSPKLVRRVILVGTGPRGGEGMQAFTSDVTEAATHLDIAAEDILYLFYTPSHSSQARGRASLDRIFSRTDREPATGVETMTAQAKALAEWGVFATGHRYEALGSIPHPVLVVNGSNDLMVPTVNSLILQQRLPNAQLIIYPDSGHAAHFQYPEMFVDDAARFLDRPED